VTKGVFVVVEGLDGVGKTTVTRTIVTSLRKSGLPTVLTREPSDGSIGCRIREMLRGETPAKDAIGMSRLYAEDRIDHLARVVLPALANEQVVICDRYLLSAIAYQHGAMGVPLADVRRFNRHVIVPDLTLILSASSDVCAERLRRRGEARTLFEDDETQRSVRRIYAEGQIYISRHNPFAVDASGDFDAVLDACMRPIIGVIAEASR
jgi:dTMP kinase